MQAACYNFLWHYWTTFHWFLNFCFCSLFLVKLIITFQCLVLLTIRNTITEHEHNILYINVAVDLLSSSSSAAAAAAVNKLKTKWNGISSVIESVDCLLCCITYIDVHCARMKAIYDTSISADYKKIPLQFGQKQVKIMSFIGDIIIRNNLFNAEKFLRNQFDSSNA